MDPYDHDLERGLRNRRAILGDAWVDQSTAKANAFTADFQNFITRFAWHEVWGRPGLTAKTRRIIVLTITCALGRWEEFELHLGAALRGGSGAALGAGDDADDTALTPDEVKEVLIQAAVYAGVPAANTGMAIAVKLLREQGHALPPVPASEVAHTGIGRSFKTASPGADVPSLHYTVREARRGPAKQTIVFSHALGCDVSMWDAVANALAAEHRVVCFDTRGHGDSDVPTGPYTMAALADDASRLIEALQCGPVAWVGLSLGGMVGQELALNHPGQVKALVIANSTSGYDDAARAGWTQRMAAIEAGGLDAIADGAMQRWFAAPFRAAQPATVARWRRRVVTQPPAGYLAACHAVMHHDTTARLPQIRRPTLVIAGSADEGTPVAMSQTIAQAIAGAELQVLDGAAHLSALEQPGAFTEALSAFLAKLD